MINIGTQILLLLRINYHTSLVLKKLTYWFKIFSKLLKNILYCLVQASIKGSHQISLLILGEFKRII